MTSHSVLAQQMRREISKDIIHDLEPILLSLRHQFDFAMALGQEESFEYFMERFGPAIKTFELMHGNVERLRCLK